MPLNAKQRMFVEEYLKDKNGTQSAIRAGYSKKTAHSIGAENLSKPEIKKAIKEGLAKLAKQTNISAQRIIDELSSIAFQKLNKNELKRVSGNKLKALEMLGKHFKLFTDVQEISGKDGGPMVVLTMPANGSEKE